MSTFPFSISTFVSPMSTFSSFKSPLNLYNSHFLRNNRINTLYRSFHTGISGIFLHWNEPYKQKKPFEKRISPLSKGKLTTESCRFTRYFAIAIFKVISPFDKSSVTSPSGIFIFPSLVYAHEFDP